jgi:geranylgeranyl pyrophosphate synthase
MLASDLSARDFVSRAEGRVAEILESGSGQTPGIIFDASRHLMSAGGKRLRPHLIGLLGSLFEVEEDPLLRVAAAVELVHAASLLHDDVVDEGKWRRGIPTANARWGNSVAVLAGDWVLTQAVLEISPLGTPIVTAAVETVAEMTRAAVLEVEVRGDATLTPEVWRRIAEGKAGALFGFGGRAVAMLANRSLAATRLDQSGRHLGVAFQMADDLRDLCDDKLGKDRFADLRNQNPSFAVALSASAEPMLQRELAAAWSKPSLSPSEAARLGDLLLSSGVALRAVTAIEEELDRGFTLLRGMASPEALSALEALGRSFIEGLAPTGSRGAA